MPKIIKILVLLMIFSANTAFGEAMRELKPVFTWSEARRECKKLEGNWDLPFAEQVMSGEISLEKYDRIKIVDFKSQKVTYNYLVWIRSDEDSLNQQLIERSQALRFSEDFSYYDNYNFSTFELENVKFRVEQLKENFGNIVRTNEEQTKLMRFLNEYKDSNFSNMYPIDPYIPLELQFVDLYYLPREIMSYEMIEILTKPSARFMENFIDNIGFEIEKLAKGIKVICLESK